MGTGPFWTKPQGRDGCQQQPRACVGLHLAVFSLPQVMVTNVTSLLKTVKAVEDEATKGTRALEATIEHIRQELAVSTAAVLRLPSHSPAALCLTAASRLAGLLLPRAARQSLHTGGLHPYDKRHHNGHSQSSGRWQLMSTGGCHRYGQPEPPCHCRYAACLQGGLGRGHGSSMGLWVPAGTVLDVNWGFPVSGFQEAAYHPEVSGDVRQRALRFGKECADGYLELLEHVLVVSVPLPVPRVGRGCPWMPGCSPDPQGPLGSAPPPTEVFAQPPSLPVPAQHVAEPLPWKQMSER